MMEAKLIDNRIVYGQVEYSIEDLYDDAFYGYANELANSFYNDTYGVNEVYINLIFPYLALNQWLDKHHPSCIDLKDGSLRLMFFAHDLCKRGHIPYKSYKSINRLKVWLEYHVTVFASAVDLFWLQLRIKQRGVPVVSDKFAVLRHKGAIKKFKRFPEIKQEIESLYDKDSIYRLFPLSRRLGWVIKAYLRSYKTMKDLSVFYGARLGKNFKYPLMDFYKKRIVYAELYRLMLDDYFSRFEGKEFYTGNNLDRYSVIEDQLCKKYRIKSFNIPHGIEYGFKFPKGFSSDVFYAHSAYAADTLNRLYDTTKFIYDASVIRRMFEYGDDRPHEKMIIFFTEPREVYVNVKIVNELLPKLKEKGWQLFLKLHPGDKRANYEGLDVNYITDYELSLTRNICISRKSTILLEAIYNGSLPLAIITNPKDKTMFTLFPSLNAEEIVKTFSVNELFEVIEANMQA